MSKFSIEKLFPFKAFTKFSGSKKASPQHTTPGLPCVSRAASASVPAPAACTSKQHHVPF